MNLEILEMLVKIACADGVITPEEMQQLKAKADVFGISYSTLNELIQKELRIKNTDFDAASGFISKVDRTANETNELSGFISLNESDSASGFVHPKQMAESSGSAGTSNSQAEFDDPTGRFFTSVSLLSEQGAMSLVYKAKRHGKWVAVKRLRNEYLSNKKYAELFYREFSNAYEFNHPNIVRLLDKGVDEEGMFYYMEYIDGRRLSQEITLRGINSGELIKKISLELLSALSYVHKQQVFHRDLKPDNILLTFKGNNVKLFDFGLAASDDFEETMLLSGTPKYSAPEQKIPGKIIDQRADLYTFGLILTEMLVGQIMDVSKVTKRGEPLKNIIEKCLQTDPEKRYNNADVLAADIAKCTIKDIKPELSISSSYIDLGEIRIKRVQTIKIQVRNSGFDKLAWRAAKQTEGIELETKPNELEINFKPNKTGNVEHIIHVLSNGGNKTITVKALVINPMLKVFIIVGVIALVLSGGSLMAWYINSKPDLITKEWLEAKSINTEEAYNLFMSRNPKHILCDSAKIYIENLTELRVWQRAVLLNTSKSFSEYLSKYPAGRFSDSAEYRKNYIANERAKLFSAAEKQEWAEAKKIHTIIAYSDFLLKYPTGTYAEAAKLLIAELEREAKEGLKVVSNVTAEEVIKGFIIDIGKRNYYSAYMRTRNSYWPDYESFSSVDLFGAISNTSINTIRTASETENTATVWVDYLATEAETGNLGFKQSFQLNKINNEWKITSVKLEEKYTLSEQSE